MHNWLKLAFLLAAALLLGYAVIFYPQAPDEDAFGPVEQEEIPASTAQRIIVLATTEPEALREQMRLADVLKELNSFLEPHQIVITPRVLRNFEEARKAFENKAIDLYYDSPAMVSVLSSRFGLDLLLVRHRDGEREYNGILFTRAESDLDRLESLIGKRFAVESELSTSTYFLPLEMLAQRGIPVAPLDSLMEQNNPDAVNVIISEQESVSLMWVLDERVDVGTMKNTRFKALDEGVRKRLRILAETPFVPREIVAISRQIDPTERQIVTQAFLALSQSARGREAMRLFQETSEFSVIESPESLAEFLERMISRPLPFEPQ